MLEGVLVSVYSETKEMEKKQETVIYYVDLHIYIFCVSNKKLRDMHNQYNKESTA